MKNTSLRVPSRAENFIQKENHGQYFKNPNKKLKTVITFNVHIVDESEEII